VVILNLNKGCGILHVAEVDIFLIHIGKEVRLFIKA